MTDEQFDDVAKGALAFEPGAPSRATWHRIKVDRWPWLPTVREVLTAGAACALLLAVLSLRLTPHQPPTAPNPIVAAALHNETRTILASVTRIPGAQPKSRIDDF